MKNGVQNKIWLTKQKLIHENKSRKRKKWGSSQWQKYMFNIIYDKTIWCSDSTLCSVHFIFHVKTVRTSEKLVALGAKLGDMFLIFASTLKRRQHNVKQKQRIINSPVQPDKSNKALGSYIITEITRAQRNHVVIFDCLVKKK